MPITKEQNVGQRQLRGAELNDRRHGALIAIRDGKCWFSTLTNKHQSSVDNVGHKSIAWCVAEKLAFVSTEHGTHHITKTKVKLTAMGVNALAHA